jgi:hypothetical protein
VADNLDGFHTEEVQLFHKQEVGCSLNLSPCTQQVGNTLGGGGLVPNCHVEQEVGILMVECHVLHVV